ncbi:MAG: HD domain-containing protein [Ruminococcaceae bacterium]|nr:HD domain-containing protein [Oscillospiraceae bacterium]
MNTELIAKTEAFLKETFAASTYLEANPAQRDYRLEHSYRVANIAKIIAENENFDVTYAVIAALLHDIAYCEEMATREDWKNHGRRSAAIARPFLESLGLPTDAANEICYGIAIHVDDEADFAWERTPFAETVGDADNIDRFDAYRIYETLEYHKFSEMSLEKKKETVASTIEKLTRFKDMNLGTQTAKKLWLQRLDDYIGFYKKLSAQLDNSFAVL